MSRENNVNTRKKGRAVLAVVLLLVVLAAAYVFRPTLERLYFKLDYEEAIILYSQQYELDEYLVAAVIHTESGNDSNALSHAGAMGLMQIMPSTGEWIAQKNDEPLMAKDDLYDPDRNIRYGCWYLRFLFDKFGDDNLSLVLAAYNAGPGRVDEWLTNDEVSENGKLVNIPYKETKDYVKKVQLAYEKYEELYPSIG